MYARIQKSKFDHDSAFRVPHFAGSGQKSSAIVADGRFHNGNLDG